MSTISIVAPVRLSEYGTRTGYVRVEAKMEKSPYPPKKSAYPSKMLPIDTKNAENGALFAKL